MDFIIGQLAPDAEIAQQGFVFQQELAHLIDFRDGNDPLFKVKNGENALAFYSHYYQPLPLVLRGYGAGNDVTAAGVFADLLRTLSWKLGV